jgi:hypothetical protein
VSLLWIALGLILGIDIRFDDTSGWAGMIRRRLSGTFQQLYRPEFFQNDAAPIVRRAHGRQTTLARSAVLIAEYAKLMSPIPAQSMRAEQSVALFIGGADRSFIGHRHRDQPINLFHRLDLRFDNTHPTFHDTACEAISHWFNFL